MGIYEVTVQAQGVPGINRERGAGRQDRVEMASK